MIAYFPGFPIPCGIAANDDTEIFGRDFLSAQAQNTISVYCWPKGDPFTKGTIDVFLLPLNSDTEAQHIGHTVVMANYEDFLREEEEKAIKREEKFMRQRKRC